LDGAGAKLGDGYISLERFRELPVLTAAELMGEPTDDSTDAEGAIRVQLESITEEDYDTIVLRRNAYQAMVSLYARYWRQASVRRGDKVLVCDFGGSLVALVASGSFCTLSRVGVAESLGCVAVCNDGIPEFVKRSLHIMEAVRPAVVFVRADLIPPLVNAMKSEEFDAVAHGVQRIVITVDQDLAMGSLDEAAKVGIASGRLLREDRALFSMVECETGQGFHIAEDFFYVEVIGGDAEALEEGRPGRLVVTNLFWKTAPAIRYATCYFGGLHHGPCGCGSVMPLFMPRWASSNLAP